MFRFAKWFLYTVLATVAMAGCVTACAADLIFRDGFELPTFRGTNLAGMEMAYINFDQSTGPVADHDYSVYDTRVIDFYVSKRMTAFRFFFS